MNAGQNCTVQPLKTRQHIEAIKRVLGDSPRDLALFSVGVNAGLRGSDLLGLRWSNVLTGEGAIRRVLEVNEGKTGHLRRIAISDAMRVALCAWAMASCEAMGEGSSHGMAGGDGRNRAGNFPHKIQASRNSKKSPSKKPRVSRNQSEELSFSECKRKSDDHSKVASACQRVDPKSGH